MKNLFPLSIMLVTLCFLYGFTFHKVNNIAVDLSGEWNLEIDETIDGNISGSNGCNIMQISSKGINNFMAKYKSCPHSKKARNSHFSGQIYVSNRGTLINMIQDNLAATQYYSAWSGKMIETGEIIGIWTDVAGKQGEFRLSR